MTLFDRIDENTNLLGIPRESEYSNSVIHLKDFNENLGRDFFISTNGDFWRNLFNPKSNRWSTYYSRSEQKINLGNITFLEQGTMLLSNHFARWYFNQIKYIITEMAILSSDWVIDIMWCGALFDYSKKNCRIFEFPVWHLDHGTLTSHYTNSKVHKGSWSNLYVQHGMKLKKIASQNEKFNKWMTYAHPHMKLFAKMYNYQP